MSEFPSLIKELATSHDTLSSLQKEGGGTSTIDESEKDKERLSRPLEPYRQMLPGMSVKKEEDKKATGEEGESGEGVKL